LPGAFGVGSGAAALDVPDSTLLIHHEGSAVCQTEEAQHAVLLRNHSPSVTEKRELDSDFLREAFVRRLVVDADSDDLRIRLLKLGDASLVRLKFPTSCGCVGKNVKRQDNILLSAKAA